MGDDERKFIHDISNPIAVAMGNVRLMLRRLEEEPEGLQPREAKERLDKVLDALNRLNDVLTARRQFILSNPVSYKREP